MKLIDLLVQELPKRGGWPDGVSIIEQDSEGQLFEMESDYCSDFNLEESDDWLADTVTKQQYETALAASQKPAWGGEGLPPVGCECEWRDRHVGWLPVKIKYISEQIVVIESPTNLCGVQKLTEIAKDIICDKPQFRPLRTEADKKREAAVEAIDYWMPEFIEDTPNQLYHAKKLYDAIAAGKIPGVKLED
ncbi:MAG: hypothetical protein E7L15_17590 [Citrobacter portucalensis]|nr:hypothetical protein [Citrobacter portucalensis]